jgi:cell wall-active antibiotic response 4TMS protein YvqF
VNTCTPSLAQGPKGRLALGLVFIAVGLLLTFDQAGIVNLEGFGRFWPLLLIGIGIVKVRQPLEDGQRAVGTALLLVGGFFQLLGILSWGRAWPILLVGAGGLLLWQAIETPRDPAPTPSTSPFVSEFVFLGGYKRSLRVADFRGGYVTAVMGGIELDLRQCRMASSPVVLDVVAFWGGIDLKVPPDWIVEAKVVPVMGGFEQKSALGAGPEPSEGPRLVVRGYAVMGGVVIGH